MVGELILAAGAATVLFLVSGEQRLIWRVRRIARRHGFARRLRIGAGHDQRAVLIPVEPQGDAVDPDAERYAPLRQALHHIHTHDGIRFIEQRLLIPLPRVDRDTLDDDLSTWIDAALQLEQFARPQAAWHALQALAEDEDVDRVTAHLRLLRAEDPDPALLDRLAERFELRPPHHRLGAAMALDRLDLVERCLDADGALREADVARAVHLLWDHEPGFERLVGWVRHPRPAVGRVALSLPGADAHLDAMRPLLSEMHDDTLARVAHVLMERAAPEDAVPIARLVLDRALRAPAAWAETSEMALALALGDALTCLGHHGGPPDIARVAPWRAHPPVAEASRTMLAMLTARHPLPPGGAVSIAAADDVTGALSTPTDREAP